MAGKLSPLEVSRQITPGKYPDGDGLYLVVASATSRNWSYRYWIGGKERWHGLGSLQEVSLKEARIKRDTARQEVRAGFDIVQAKRAAREAKAAAAATTAAPTFTAPALAILDKMRDGSQGDLIFPAAGDEPFSDMAMLAVLDRLGYGHVTVHGFRATFATWAEECTDYPDGVREAALAHKYKNETMAAYQRGEKLEKRRALMLDWADFIVGSNVVPISVRERS